MQKYDVFARLHPGDDTIHIGNVTAQNERLAKMYAYETFDEEDWDYMVVVAQDDLHEVTGEMPTAGVSQ